MFNASVLILTERQLRLSLLWNIYIYIGKLVVPSDWLGSSVIGGIDTPKCPQSDKLPGDRWR